MTKNSVNCLIEISDYLRSNSTLIVDYTIQIEFLLLVVSCDERLNKIEILNKNEILEFERN